LDQKRLREVTTMSERIDNITSTADRYQKTNVIEHLASQFVLGTLSGLVKKRVLTLRKNNELLESRILFWQEKLVCIDEKTAELPPSDQSWSVIANALNLDLNSVESPVAEKDDQPVQEQQGLLSRITDFFYNAVRSTPFFSTPMHQLTTAFSVVVIVLATLFINPVENNPEQLSYVAVLTEDDGSAHLVASTYGESQKLIVNIVNTPVIEQEQALELWVVSKTDSEARSLGVIPQGETLIEQQLTEAQWRLIQDSESLIVTIEDAGGSPIGEPSEYIVSRGLCVRLQEWNANV